MAVFCVEAFLDDFIKFPALSVGVRRKSWLLVVDVKCLLLERIWLIK